MMTVDCVFREMILEANDVLIHRQSSKKVRAKAKRTSRGNSSPKHVVVKYKSRIIK